VRCFENENVTHVEGNVDPVRDAELIETELLLADIQTLEKSVNRLSKLSKKEKRYHKDYNLLFLQISESEFYTKFIPKISSKLKLFKTYLIF